MHQNEQYQNIQTHAPLVSVVMPIRNEAAYIEQSLRALLEQDYPHGRMELLIADGMSTDLTRDIVREITAGQDIHVRILDNPGKIVPTGMNLAIAAAQGEIILRVDGHAMLQADYVRRCVDHLLTSDAACVGGIILSTGKGFMGKAIALAMSSPFGVGDSGFRTASAYSSPRETDTVPFGAYRREIFDKVGLFNEKMLRHQDYEFNYRLRQAGEKIILLPEARATYFVRSSLVGLWRQYWQYGLYKGRFLKKFPSSLRLRHLIPPLFVVALLITGGYAFLTKTGRLTFLFLLILYGIFQLTAAFSLILEKKTKFIVIFPVILLFLHVSWGSGTLIGFLKKTDG